MSKKVLEVMRQVLAKPERIQDTYKSGGELFFRYNGFAFSVLRAQDRGPEFGPYSFFVYPNWHNSLLELAKASERDPDSLTMASYDSGQFPEDREKEAFRDLHNLVLNKHLNVDSIFDNILSSK